MSSVGSKDKLFCLGKSVFTLKENVCEILYEIV